MGSMTRRMMRNARRRLGEMTDGVFEALERLADLGERAGDEEVIRWCEHALTELEDSLTPDGLPTSTTEQILPQIIDGPLMQALQRLRPDGSLPETSVRS